MQELYDPDVQVGDPTQVLVSPQGSGSQDKQSGLCGLQRPAGKPRVGGKRGPGKAN